MVSCEAPPRQCSPPKFWRLCVVCGRSREGGFGNVVFGFIPFSSAAAVVTSLNVEPGGNSSWDARDSSGLEGSLLSCFDAVSTLDRLCEASWLGL